MLDDAMLDRARRLYCEQADFADIYVEQARRWSVLDLEDDQRARVKMLSEQAAQLRPDTTNILALTDELAHGTIDTVLATRDEDVALQRLLGNMRP
ncbi:hypothetical protein [Haloactinomyces albus]|uniref:Cell division septum initiation protein DivIVA n=1 Tax=Haloactinomyces albus TaxID=1352928 RepID=A0AAE3ZGW4_9ACTN|nr:hypothetical protein [Haloactinomyces albus]MDR7303383.1 cell division septum initiation protein DivIVA [Haloactinomyces albus]